MISQAGILVVAMALGFTAWDESSEDRQRSRIQSQVELGFTTEAEHAARLDLGQAVARSPDSVEVLSCLENLAVTLNAQGKFDQARTVMKRATEFQWRYPDNEYHLVRVRRLMIMVNLGLGDVEAAEKSASETLSKPCKTTQANMEKAEILNTLAWSDFSKNAMPQAKGRYKAEIELREKLVGPMDVSLTNALNSLAYIALGEQQNDEARRYAVRACGLTKQNTHADKVRLSDSLTTLGVVDIADEKYEPALKLFDEALKIRDLYMKQDALKIECSLENLCRTIIHITGMPKGEKSNYVDVFARWTEMRRRLFGDKSVQVVDSLVAFETLLRQVDRKADSKRVDQEISQIVGRPTRGQ